MYTFLMIIHVIISIGLILVILAQSSKGGALDGLLVELLPTFWVVRELLSS